jgi:alkylhydroperoxidase/carboxymuconolactone decarboxylase family protein YurZ
MTTSQRTWRDLVGDYDPVAQEKMLAYIGHITAEEPIEQPYRELMLFATSSAIRFRSSMETHGRRALEEGATREQLFQAAALAALSSGFPTLILAMEVVEDLVAATR